MKTKLDLIPYPREVDRHPGRFLLREDAIILVESTGDTQAAEQAAEILAQHLRPPTGYAFPIKRTAADAPPGSIRFAGGDPGLADEEYRLRVEPEQVVIRAPTQAGFFYGIQTFLQLLPAEIRSQWEVPKMKPVASTLGWNFDWSCPCVAITDGPRFGWRGLMIDCSRHFRKLETLQWVIETMAKLKMNRLHLHLTDNHGWRVEVPQYPRLTEIGARTEPEPRRHGFYTADDLREVVAHAARHQITVIPEIDIPGHVWSAVSAYPSLCCTGKPTRDDRSAWHQQDILCAGHEEVFTFLEAVFGQLLEIFPGPWIHVGGDEAPKARWKACPRCQQRIRDEGLANEEELQGYLISRVADFLRRNGRTVIGWEEVLEGGGPSDAVAQWWRSGMGNAVPVNALRAGHRLVVSRSDFSYFGRWDDMDRFFNGVYLPDELRYTEDRRALRHGEPIPEWENILGAECCLWGETTPDSLLYARLFPAIFANAELQWRYSDPEKRDLPDLKRRAARVRDHIEGNRPLNWGS